MSLSPLIKPPQRLCATGQSSLSSQGDGALVAYSLAAAQSSRLRADSEAGLGPQSSRLLSQPPRNSVALRSAGSRPVIVCPESAKGRGKLRFPKKSLSTLGKPQGLQVRLSLYSAPGPEKRLQNKA